MCIRDSYLPDGFLHTEEDNNGFDNTICIVDAFELEYFIPVPVRLIDKKSIDVFNNTKCHIRITKAVEETPIFEWVNRHEYSDKIDKLGKTEIQLLLPKYVLGYSSGENELLSLPFFKTRRCV